MGANLVSSKGKPSHQPNLEAAYCPGSIGCHMLGSGKPVVEKELNNIFIFYLSNHSSRKAAGQMVLIRVSDYI